MAAELDHLLVPARDRVAAARLIAHLLDAPWATQGTAGPFSPVYVNNGLTLDFDEWTEPVPVLHFCFRVTPDEFEAALGRIAGRAIAYRSTPHGPADGRVNTAYGGRIVYWSEPDGHVWELLTESYERRPSPSAAGTAGA